MRKVFFILMVCFFSALAAVAQQTQYLFTSSRFQTIENSTQQESGVFIPIKVFIDIKSNQITIEELPTEISRMLDNKTNFTINGAKSGLKGIQLFSTEEGFIFTVNSQAQNIVIGKPNVSPRVFSVWFFDIKL